MNVRELIGKRILIKAVGGYVGVVEEVKVLEVSPAGQWVKLMNLYGKKYWKPVTDIALVEVLTELHGTEEKPPA